MTYNQMEIHPLPMTVRKGHGKLKSGKAVDPSGIIAKILKANGEGRKQMLRQPFKVK